MALKDILHQQKEKFKGTTWAPAFNALHTFLFVPNETTHSGSHIRDGVDLKRVMSTVILALLPCLLFGMWNAGYQWYLQDAGWVAANGAPPQFLESFSTGYAWSYLCIGFQKIMPLVLVSYGVGLAIEFLFAIIRKHEVNEGYLVTGMLVPLIVPIDIPLWMLAIAVVFGVVIGKEVFGGTGMNILNPALTIRAFLFFAYPSWISGSKVWVNEGSTDAISGETVLGYLAQNKTFNVDFSTLDYILGYIPGSVGETSLIAIGLGALLLIITGVGSWRIMLSMLAGGALMALLFNLWGLNELMRFQWYDHLLVGGFAFGMVFMATDPVTAAQTNKGKWIYGFLIGVISILVRVFNPAFPEGVMMAILLMNVFAPTIDHYVIQGNIKKRQKRLKLANS